MTKNIWNTQGKEFHFCTECIAQICCSVFFQCSYRSHAQICSKCVFSGGAWPIALPKYTFVCFWIGFGLLSGVMA